MLLGINVKLSIEITLTHMLLNRSWLQVLPPKVRGFGGHEPQTKDILLDRIKKTAEELKGKQLPPPPPPPPRTRC